MSAATTSSDYLSRLRRRFRQHRPAWWSLRLLYVLLVIAIFADFLANERPIIAKYEGAWHFPVFRQYSDALGFTTDQNRSFDYWQQRDYDFCWLAPIPYSPATQDRRNRQFVGPLDEQRIESWRFRHWLGTDEIGRDVAAGMIGGTRTAMLVGLIAMSIATVIGIFFGAVAGYFGNRGVRWQRGQLLIGILALPLAYFYAFVAGSVSSDFSVGVILGRVLMFSVIVGVLFGVGKVLPLPGWWRRPVVLPLDSLVMRGIETMNSIPALLLLLAVVAAIGEPSILYVMIIIGLIRWTGIARFVRAELLRIRQLTYIEAARALGYGHWRILLRHALPNALGPVLITTAFGIASAILLEALLSFLGIGVAANEVTWGSLLSSARRNVSAWWLAVFPGLAIFVTVTIFNLIGEGLTEAMEGRSSN